MSDGRGGVSHQGHAVCPGVIVASVLDTGWRCTWSIMLRQLCHVLQAKQLQSTDAALNGGAAPQAQRPPSGMPLN